MTGDTDFAEEVEHVLERIEANPQELEAVRALVNLYGEALRRVSAGADPVEDDLLSRLLLVHDLLPTEALDPASGSS